MRSSARWALCSRASLLFRRAFATRAWMGVVRDTHCLCVRCTYGLYYTNLSLVRIVATVLSRMPNAAAICSLSVCGLFGRYELRCCNERTVQSSCCVERRESTPPCIPSIRIASAGTTTCARSFLRIPHLASLVFRTMLFDRTFTDDRVVEIDVSFSILFR